MNGGDSARTDVGAISRLNDLHGCSRGRISCSAETFGFATLKTEMLIQSENGLISIAF
jgi:hypothetical protein